MDKSLGRMTWGAQKSNSSLSTAFSMIYGKGQSFEMKIYMCIWNLISTKPNG